MSDPLPERPPRRPFFHRMAQAADARNRLTRPAPVVLALALRDAAFGSPVQTSGDSPPDSTPSGAAGGGPSCPVPSLGSTDLDPTRVARAGAVAAVAVAAVFAICLGTLQFIGSFPSAPGADPTSDGAGDPTYTATALGAGGPLRSDGARPSLGDLVSATVLSADSSLDADLRRRFEALRQRPALPPGLPVGAPVAGVISSPFGLRLHPVSGRRRVHRGTDFAVPLRTPVRATADGRVMATGRRSGYGLTVEVEHRDPSGLRTSTLYGHLDAVPLGIIAGAPVLRGDLVGLSGGVGPGAGVSTGPHVHYEVRSLSGSEPVALDPVVLYDRVEAWRGETLRRLRSLTAEARHRVRGRSQGWRADPCDFIR